ncbi:MAG: type II toxin-antitoxin system VapC family toxin [Acidobacteriota bacterium]
MIGLDTNVLVRYLAEDDKAQADRVQRLLAAARTRGEAVYVSLVVLCETYWVLRSVLDRSRSDILDALESLLTVDVFHVEEQDVVRQALEASIRGKGDFTDHLIGHLHLARGCRHTATFDRALRAAPGFTVL